MTIDNTISNGVPMRYLKVRMDLFGHLGVQLVTWRLTQVNHILFKSLSIGIHMEKGMVLSEIMNTPDDGLTPIGPILVTQTQEAQTLITHSLHAVSYRLRLEPVA